MNIEKSFSFQFEDKEWISKLGLGAIISMVPVLNIAWTGYLVSIVRNVMANVPEPLPTWDDLGKKFTDGLILAAAWFVYALPMIIMLCIPGVFLISSGVLSNSTDLQDFSQILGGVGLAAFFALLCVFMLYGLILSVIYPAILAMFALEGSFGSCFRFGQILNLMNRNPSAFLTAWGMTFVASFAISMMAGLANLVLNWIPCIGWIAGLIITLGSVVYIRSIQAHLVGQFGAIASATLTPALSLEGRGG